MPAPAATRCRWRASVREVVALDPSASMLGALREGAREFGVTNVRAVEGRWPDASAKVGTGEVALIAHVGYDIEAIDPFLDAMEAAVRRLCVAVMMERAPASAAEPFWEAVHGEPRRRCPAWPTSCASCSIAAGSSRSC